MTESSWDEYVTGDDGGTAADPAAGAGTDTIRDEVLAGQAADQVSDAATASDWSDWNAATGDDATTSANSYFEAATEAEASGSSDLADEYISDGNMELGVAAGGYSQAASYDQTASSNLEGAGEDYGSLSAETGSDDYATEATDAGAASDDYSAAASDYSDASADATLSADSSDDDS